MLPDVDVDVGAGVGIGFGQCKDSVRPENLKVAEFTPNR
jgi:hypothetical protein